MSRILHLDILKAILIICVVIGHTNGAGLPYLDVFWFHMPAFFMVSGLVNRSWTLDRLSFHKKMKRQVVPYFAYSVLLWIIFQQEPLLKNIVRTIYGGSFNITTVTYSFWFTNALFVTLIAYSWLKTKLSTKVSRGGICC